MGRKKSSDGSPTAKGRMLEAIVAAMHKAPGVSVHRNARLKLSDGREREIDVLLVSEVSGYPIRVAIECKNEINPIGEQKIDAFIAKLQDVRIPVQQGIFVSASRFTKDAQKRAEKEGLRTLRFRKIGELVKGVDKAFNSQIYLLAIVKQVRFSDDGQETNRILEFIFHALWKNWMQERIPSILGTYDIELPDLAQWIKGQFNRQIPELKVIAEVQVIGNVITIPGIVQHFALHDASTDRQERFHVQANFSMKPGRYPVQRFETEEELASFLPSGDGIQISIGRFRLPRIRSLQLNWPPSETVGHRIQEFNQESSRSEDRVHSEPWQTELEEFGSFWDPIWAVYPTERENTVQLETLIVRRR